MIVVQWLNKELGTSGAWWSLVKDYYTGMLILLTS